MPGGILTELSQHRPRSEVEGMMQSEVVMKVVKNAEQGAATTVWAAIGAHAVL